MPQGLSRDPRKERYWRSLLCRQRRSGLSIRDFCRQHDCSEPSFYAWRRTLQQRDHQADAPTLTPVTFVPLAVQTPLPAEQTGLELLLANGRRLRIPPGCSTALLRQLLAVLEELPC